MRHSLSLFLTVATLATTANAFQETQSDWSGGEVPPGAVEAWGQTFAKATQVSWRSIPGQLALHSQRVASPVGHNLALSPVSFGVRCVDLDGDGLTELAVGSPFHGEDAIEQGLFRILGLKGCLVSSFCTSSPNSAGAGAVIGLSGCASIATADFTLTVNGAVPGQFGLFFYGARQTEVPFGDGSLCVSSGGAGLFRLSPAAIADGTGHVSRWVDFGAPPASGGPGEISAGSTWNFQHWYRDPAAGGVGFNLSDGLSVGFCP